MKKNHGYRPETIAKYMMLINQAIIKAVAILSTLHVCIVRGNRKLGRILNVSLAPLLTCGGACRVCKMICYDIKACLFRPTVLWARARNTALALYDRDRYFAEIEHALSPRRKIKAFRWHVGGDIPDYDYFCHMVDVARRFPDWRFWTYTKQYEIVNRYIAEHGGSIGEALPENLSIMFSVWADLECINPYGFATFECVLDGHEWPDGITECPGNCEICLDGGTGCPWRKSSAVHEH